MTDANTSLLENTGLNWRKKKKVPHHQLGLNDGNLKEKSFRREGENQISLELYCLGG